MPAHDPRTAEQIREHYVIERELAARLRVAGKEERRRLYTEVYNELFRRVPHHPQLAAKTDASVRAETIYALKLVRRFINPESVYLEIGPGDCALALEVAKLVRTVYAVDVSDEISQGLNPPKNFALVISDGSSIPVPPESIDVVFSDQLMEHLHPDDAREQLANVYHALKPGGICICITPNRLSGPHDVSRHFDDIATGFHLKEYTIAELSAVFREAGFRKLRLLIGARGFSVSVPVVIVRLVESLFEKLPKQFTKTVARRFPLRLVLGIKLTGSK